MNMKPLTAISALLVFAGGITACGGSSSGESNPTVAPIPPDVTVVDASGNTSVDLSAFIDQLAVMPLGALTAEEEAGLQFMREEEKLAHDLYSQLDILWQQAVFSNIAMAELTHTEAVLALLERYSVTDPVGLNPAGVFVNPTLQGLHDLLVAQGSSTLVDALVVGAEIEEIDILDLDLRLASLVSNEDIQLVYESLQKGSRNHLRAFANALSLQNVIYLPQHLTTAAYDAIINTPMESGGNG